MPRRSDTYYDIDNSQTGLTSGFSSPTDLSSMNPYDTALAEGQYVNDLWEWMSGKQRRSLMSKSADFNAEVALMNMENEYNSPINQAIRQRQAGLNPDLVGVAQHTAASGSAPSGQADLGGLSLSDVGSFFSTAFSIIKGGFSIFKSIKEAQNIGAITQNILTETAINEEKAKLFRQEVIKRSFSNIEDLTGYVSRLASTFFPETLKDYYSYIDSDDFKSVWNATLESDPDADFLTFLKDNKSPALKLNFDDLDIFPEEVLPSANNILQQLITQRSELLRSDLYKVLGKSASERTDYIQTVSDPYYNESDDTMTDLYLGYYTMLRDLSKATGENKLKFQQSYSPEKAASSINEENSFQSEYYQSLDAEIIGLSESESSRSSYIVKKYYNDVQSIINQYVTDLSNKIRTIENPVVRTMSLLLLQEAEKMRVTLEESFFNNLSTATDASKAMDLVSGISDFVF